jgi:hypothetical protein
MKRLVLFGVAVAMLVAGVASASAAVVIGNSPTPRPNLDTYQNFVVADASAPAASAGYINQVSWYAQLDSSGTQGSVALAVVHPDSASTTSGNTFTVKWISADQPLPSVSGVQTLSLGALVPVAAGDDLAVYSSGTGVVPFDYSPLALPAFWAANGSGKPAVGEVTIDQNSTDAGQQGRNYSMNASNVPPTSKDQCKNGGYKQFTDPNGNPFKNQGDCVSFTNNGK